MNNHATGKSRLKGRRLRDLLEGFGSREEGGESYKIVEGLYPTCRSITGDGVRSSLRLLQRTIQLELHEVPSGTQVFDWTVPNEWNIRDAYIKNSAGERVVDFRQNNLHVLNYSVPVHRTMPFAELRPHLFTLPETPDWIPYRTSYYRETWGFCLSHRQLEQMADREYEVCVDSTLAPGSLTYGEYWIQGSGDDEVPFAAGPEISHQGQTACHRRDSHDCARYKRRSRPDPAT
jgi:aminopeptidase-like protein